jgi:nucleoside-specific outer membrane channel protein Tsx
VILKSLKIGLVAIFCLMGTSKVAMAEKFFQFHTTNLQFLAGQNYKLGKDSRALFTFEHANTFTYGDSFLFIDHTIDTGTYGEFSPRLSLGKMTGNDISIGFIKDLYVSSNFEFGKNIKTRFLIGGAVDLDIPGFVFFKVNVFRRNDPKLVGSTHQVTLAWLKPFQIGNADFVFEGFADFSGSEGVSSSNELIVPKLTYDLGKSFGNPGKISIGIEFSYWHNKFGLKGVTEAVPQFVAKWVF